MKAINLLPRKSRIETVFVPTIVALVALSMITSSILLWQGERWSSDQLQLERKAAMLRSQLEALTKEKQASPLAVDYEKFSASVKQLQSSETNWLPVFDAITANLPQASRLVQMSVNEAGRIDMRLEFMQMNEAAQYIARLQQTGVFRSVSISDVGLSYASKRPANAGQAVPSGGASNGSGIGSSNQQQQGTNPVDSIISSMRDSLPAPKTESDSLLNEMQWFVNQQMVKNSFGITLPELNEQQPSAQEAGGSGTASGNTGLQSGLFTQKELDDAAKALQAFKNQQKILQQPETQRSTNTSQSESGSQGAKASPEQNLIPYYSVSLNLELKKSDQPPKG